MGAHVQASLSNYRIVAKSYPKPPVEVMHGYPCHTWVDNSQGFWGFPMVRGFVLHLFIVVSTLSDTIHMEDHSCRILVLIS